MRSFRAAVANRKKKSKFWEFVYLKRICLLKMCLFEILKYEFDKLSFLLKSYKKKYILHIKINLFSINFERKKYFIYSRIFSTKLNLKIFQHRSNHKKYLVIF